MFLCLIKTNRSHQDNLASRISPFFMMANFLEVMIEKIDNMKVTYPLKLIPLSTKENIKLSVYK